MRRLFLVAYDITEPRRLRQVNKVMKGFGDRVQYSVFLCSLSANEVTGMKWVLGETMNQLVDQVLILDLGRDDGTAEARFQFLGRPPVFPSSGSLIV